MDDFQAYSRVIHQDMTENIGKMYIGKGVLFDKHGVEEALRGIEARVDGFMEKHSKDIDRY